MQTRIFALIVFVFMALSANVHAQWAKSIGGLGEDSAVSICATADGGFAVAGFTSSFGVSIDDFWVVKMDASGNIQWQKAYGGLDFELASGIRQTSDGGFIVIGFGQSFSPGNGDVWLLKLDSSGNIEWQKDYGTSASETGSSVIQTSDGGYLFAGTAHIANANYDVWLVKLSSSGNIQWQKTYGGTASEEDGNTVRQLSNGSFVVIGGTSSFGAGMLDGWLLLVDSLGNAQFSKAYGGANSDTFFSVEETPDGALLALGLSYSFSTGDRDIWVVKMTLAGDIIWQRHYGGPGYDQPGNLYVTSDNKYIIAGSTLSFGAGDSDAWILELDNNGNILWQKAYGGTGGDYAAAVTIASGRIIVSGATQSFSSGFQDAWLLNLQPDGTIDPSCPLMTDTLVTAGTSNTVPVLSNEVEGATSVTIQNTTVSPLTTTATVTDLCGVSCVFCDDFENGILDPNWNYVKPSWSETGGNLIATATKKALAVAAPAFAGCTDCAFEAGMMSDGSAGNKMSMLAWYTDKGNNVEVMMKQQSGKFIVKQKAGGTVVAKTKALMSLQANVSYDVRVEYDGTALHLIVNGSDIASIAAPAPAAGTMALSAAKTTARFSHILVE